MNGKRVGLFYVKEKNFPMNVNKRKENFPLKSSVNMETLSLCLLKEKFDYSRWNKKKGKLKSD